MKEKIIGIMVCTLMICSVVAVADVSKNSERYGTISVNINIGPYEIISTENGENIYVKDFGHLLIPGMPNLPSRIFSIAIPPGAKLVDIDFELGGETILSNNHYIIPVSLPGVIGEVNPIVQKQEEKKYEENYNSIYFSNDPYPSSNVEFVRTAGFRKYNLVDVRVIPFTYQPLSKELKYFSEVEISVRYELPRSISADEILVDNSIKMESSAEEIIYNYNQAKNWYTPAPIGRDSYNYVIITIDSLVSSVSTLKSWEESKGRTVNVVTTSWINSNYAGYDLAEKIRNFLRDKYPSSEWGIEDVCLVGHYDDVPMRRCEQNTGYGKPETDYYYAELSLPDSDSWDQDGDHKYGENSDPIDFYAEVNVGRIPWSSSSTVSSICQKSKEYEENSDSSYKKNILLLGAFFWPDTDNAVLMEEKIDQTWMASWTKTRMYEQGQSSYPMDYNLDYNNVKNIWSAGKYAFVNWAGHGSPTACYEYYPSQAFVNTGTCNYLNDDYPSIVFADACSNSDTDHLNIGQAMLKKGAVGFLGSTKVAYGKHAWNDPSDGSSQSMDYYFTTKVTSTTYSQGEAHQSALRTMYLNDLWYYTKYEMFEWGALWGNPNLGMGWVSGENLPPNDPSNPDPFDGESDVDEDADLSWTCTDPNGDPITYDVYFGTDSNPPLVSSDQTDNSYDPGIMAQGQKYYWKIVAEDDEGESTEGSVWDFTVFINDPPNPPENPNPADGAVDVDVDIILTWVCTDPDEDPLTFSIYFEAEDHTPDELVSEGQTEFFYDPPGSLEFNTQYYWRIVAYDPSGASYHGEVWDFTTGDVPNNPPNQPDNPSPIDGATDVSVNIDLSWTCSDPDGDTLVYDVYLEANNPDPNVLVSDDQIGTYYDPGTLDHEVTYYWKIAPKDEHGAITIGPVWQFTTGESVNSPPGKPTIEGPDNGIPGTEYVYVLNAVDPDADDVKYHIDWGDDETETTIFNPSGNNVWVNHIWDTSGSFTIKVKAEDSNGLIGPEETFSVSMPRNRLIKNPVFTEFIQRLESFLHRYPNAFPVIKSIFGLS